MKRVKVCIGSYTMIGRLEEEKAPKTCQAICEMLPIHSKVIHVRWSGEAIWIPYGENRFPVSYENHTSYPAKGEMLVYPGGISEMEMILPYGRCHFASQVGQLAGNHFLTIEEGLEFLPEIGRSTLWDGAQTITIELI